MNSDKSKSTQVSAMSRSSGVLRVLARESQESRFTEVCLPGLPCRSGRQRIRRRTSSSTPDRDRVRPADSKSGREFASGSSSRLEFLSDGRTFVAMTSVKSEPVSNPIPVGPALQELSLKFR